MIVAAGIATWLILLALSLMLLNAARLDDDAEQAEALREWREADARGRG